MKTITIDLDDPRWRDSHRCFYIDLPATDRYSVQITASPNDDGSIFAEAIAHPIPGGYVYGVQHMAMPSEAAPYRRTIAEAIEDFNRHCDHVGIRLELKPCNTEV